MATIVVGPAFADRRSARHDGILFRIVFTAERRRGRHRYADRPGPVGLIVVVTEASDRSGCL